MDIVVGLLIFWCAVMSTITCLFMISIQDIVTDIKRRVNASPRYRL